jgi:hypothetical protein
VQATTTRLQQLFLWLAPAVVTAGYVGVAVEALAGRHVPVALWILGSVMVPMAWWSFLSVPRSVLIDEGKLIFVMPQRHFDIAITDMREIDAREWNSGYVVLSAGRKKVFVLRGMQDLGSVVALVLERNANTLLRGQTP